MCGIFGVVRRAPGPADRLHELARLNLARGNRAWGAAWSAPGAAAAEVRRVDAPYRPAAPPDLPPARLHLGHVRAPTGGAAEGLAAVHPFAAGGLLLAHNGLLLNHADFPDWRLDPVRRVDSQVILGGILAGQAAGLALPAAIAAAAGQLQGQQACWLWHPAGQAIYLWRVMAPSYISYSQKEITFSSKQQDEAAELLPQGAVLRLDTAALTTEVVATFPFYSPYGVG